LNVFGDIKLPRERKLLRRSNVGKKPNNPFIKNYQTEKPRTQAGEEARVETQKSVLRGNGRVAQVSLKIILFTVPGGFRNQQEGAYFCWWKEAMHDLCIPT